MLLAASPAPTGASSTPRSCQQPVPGVESPLPHDSGVASVHPLSSSKGTFARFELFVTAEPTLCTTVSPGGPVAVVEGTFDSGHLKQQKWVPSQSWLLDVKNREVSRAGPGSLQKLCGDLPMALSSSWGFPWLLLHLCVYLPIASLVCVCLSQTLSLPYKDERDSI